MGLLNFASSHKEGCSRYSLIYRGAHNTQFKFQVVCLVDFAYQAAAELGLGDGMVDFGRAWQIDCTVTIQQMAVMLCVCIPGTIKLNRRTWQ